MDYDTARYSVVRNGEEVRRCYDPGTCEYLAEQVWSSKGGHVQAIAPSGRIISEFEE